MGFIKDIKIFNKEKFFFENYSKNLNVMESKLAIHELLARIPKIFFELFRCFFNNDNIIFSTSSDQSRSDLINILPFLGLVSASIIKLLPSFKAISGSLTHIVAYTNSFFLVTDQIQSVFKEDKNIFIKKIENNSQNILELQNINFNYKKNIITLSDINLNLKSKNIIGLIGRSGSGKSTLINIILGLFFPKSGLIKLSLDKTKDTFDNKKIAYVPQDILILDDTLKRNIAFGINENEIDEKRVHKVIEKSGLLNFYNKNNLSLNVSLGELGVKISEVKNRELE